MLLRAGLIYVLAVTSLVAGAIALWQRLEIAASHDTYTALVERVEKLSDRLRQAEETAVRAERRARVAEDSIASQATNVAADGSALKASEDRLAEALGARTKLESELADATKSRNEANAALDRARNDLAEAVKKAEAAAARADKATAEMTALREEIEAAKRKPVKKSASEGSGPRVETGALPAATTPAAAATTTPPAQEKAAASPKPAAVEKPPVLQKSEPSKKTASPAKPASSSSSAAKPKPAAARANAEPSESRKPERAQEERSMQPFSF